jgi:exopolysaccharide production protein ExoQ
MKDILRNPALLFVIAGIAIVCFLILYNNIAKNKKIAKNCEKIFTATFLISISGATGAGLVPFSKLYLPVLLNKGTTPPTIIGMIVIYSIFLLLLAPRFRYTLNKMLKTLVITFIGNPFFGAVFAMIFLSFSWSTVPDISFKSSLILLVTALVAMYVAQEYTWQEMYPWWRWVNFVVVIASIIKPNAMDDGNWTGILGHKNQFSFFMAQSAVLWFLNGFYQPKERRMSMFIGLLSVVALQKGGSGASKILVIVLIGLFCYLSLVKKLPVQWAFVSVVVFLILSICVSILVVDNIEAIVVKGLNKDLTLTGRTEFWPQIVDKINLQPVLGYGISGFWRGDLGLQNPAHGIMIVKSGFVPPHSHNGYLDLATELGWLGLTMYLMAYFLNLAKGVAYLTQDNLPEAGLPLFILTYQLMTNLTETGLFGCTSNWFWFVALTVRLGYDTMGKR